MAKKKNQTEIEQLQDESQINYQNNIESFYEEEISEENEINNIEENYKNKKPKQLVVRAELPKEKIIQVKYESFSDGKIGQIMIQPGYATLLQNRLYDIPVDCEIDINSDEYSMKEISSISKYISIRYIKNGVAGIISFKHGFKLNDKQELCFLSK